MICCKVIKSNHNNLNTVKIILICCNRKVNRTIMFLIFIYNCNMVGGVIQPLIFNISAHLIWFDMVFIMCNTHIIKSNSIIKA